MSGTKSSTKLRYTSSFCGGWWEEGKREGWRERERDGEREREREREREERERMNKSFTATFRTCTLYCLATKSVFIII